MSTGAGGPRVRDLFNRAAEAESLGAVIFQGIGAVFFAIGTAVASGILTVADVVIVPMQALTQAVGDLIDAIFGGAARIIATGAEVTGISFTGMFNLGPFTFAASIGSVLLALWLVRAYVAEEPTSNFFPGLPFDVPSPGLTDAEEDKKD